MDALLCWINKNGLASSFWENLRESEIFEQDDEDRGSADPVVEDTGTPPPWVAFSIECHVCCISLCFTITIISMLSYLSSSTELSLYHLTVRERQLSFFSLTIVLPLEPLHCFGLVLQGHPTLSDKFRVFFLLLNFKSQQKVLIFTVRSERESPRLSKLAEAI